VRKQLKSRMIGVLWHGVDPRRHVVPVVLPPDCSRSGLQVKSLPALLNPLLLEAKEGGIVTTTALEVCDPVPPHARLRGSHWVRPGDIVTVKRTSLPRPAVSGGVAKWPDPTTPCHASWDFFKVKGAVSGVIVYLEMIHLGRHGGIAGARIESRVTKDVLWYLDDADVEDTASWEPAALSAVVAHVLAILPSAKSITVYSPCVLLCPQWQAYGPATDRRLPPQVQVFWHPPRLPLLRWAVLQWRRRLPPVVACWPSPAPATASLTAPTEPT
jgi:hypothetical protein